MQYLTKLTKFSAGGTKIDGKFPRDFLARVTSYPKSCFRELSSGDIRVLANCKNLTEFGANMTKIDGKFPRDFPAR